MCAVYVQPDDDDSAALGGHASGVLMGKRKALMFPGPQEWSNNFEYTTIENEYIVNEERREPYILKQSI